MTLAFVACAALVCGGCAVDSAVLYERAARASVMVLIDGRHAGSAFFVDDSGLLLTASHVVKGANGTLEVDSPDVGRLPAERLAVDWGHDVALLRVARRDRPLPSPPIPAPPPDPGHKTPIGYRQPFQINLPGIVLHYYLPALQARDARHAPSRLAALQGPCQLSQHFLSFSSHHKVGYPAAHKLFVEEGGVEVPQNHLNLGMPPANRLNHVLHPVHGESQAGKTHERGRKAADLGEKLSVGPLQPVLVHDHHVVPRLSEHGGRPNHTQGRDRRRETLHGAQSVP